MPISYNWTCSACGAGNTAGIDLCHKCGINAVISAAEIEQHRKGVAEVPAPEPQSEPESRSSAIVKLVVSIAVILAGMAWFLTYDWPSGKKVGVGDFVMFWSRELIILGLLLVAFLAIAFQSIRAKLKSDNNNEQDDATEKRHT